MENLHPIYVILFCNDGTFSRLIRRSTGSQYSHATISLDPSLNEMYSFTNIPYATSRTLLGQPTGLVRESIWGPMYGHNIYFTVLITFVNDDGFNEIKNKIDFFIKNHDKYKYNDLGLIKYFFNIRTKKTPDITKKTKWFCSEFVSYLLKVGGKPGIDTIMKSPQDLYDSDLYVESIDYTLKSFSEKDLIEKTNQAKNKYVQYMEQKKLIATESSYLFDINDNFYEFDYIANEAVNLLSKINEKKRTEWSLINYTALLNWKYLHEQFVKYFGIENLDSKFDMIELIIRSNLKKIGNSDIMKFIIIQFSKIAKVLVNAKITNIDKKTSAISYIQRGKRETIYYNELIEDNPTNNSNKLIEKFDLI